MKPGFLTSEVTHGKLIALGGKLRAGKDAVGDRLVSEHGFVKLGMSDPLNAALLALNPVVILDFDVIPEKPWSVGLRRGKYHRGEYIRYADLHAAVGYVEAKRHREVRELLQRLGTEVGRDMIHPDVWVRMAETRIRALWAEGKDVVITAMRFPNETAMVRRLGGLTAWVHRTAPDEDAVDAGIASHASEGSVSHEDFYVQITNDSTLEALYTQADALVGDYQELAHAVQVEASRGPYDVSASVQVDPSFRYQVWNERTREPRPVSRVELMKQAFSPPYDR